jgi:hypothetical protein
LTIQFVVSFFSQIFVPTMEGYPHDGDYSQSQGWNQNPQEMWVALSTAQIQIVQFENVQL